MDLTIDLGDRGDRSTRLYRALREAIVDGRLPPGERLPPSRELARRLGVSRGTVTVAYELLAAEGFVTGRVGSGTVVSADRPEPAYPVPPSPAPIPRPPILPVIQSPAPTFDLRVGTPDPDLFPLGAWRRAVASVLQPEAFRDPANGDPAGIPALRAAISRHIGITRAVRAVPDQVVVTSGAQQGLDLVGRIAIRPGVTVAVEEPGYLPVREAWSSLGGRVVGVPVDAEGIRVDALPDDAWLVHVTPSHQFPTGVTLSLARRTALLAWAERRGAIIVEDDYDSEFRFRPRPLEPVQALDRSGSVVYVGSFSKTLSPRLRLGFLVAPARLVPALVTARHLADWTSEAITQLAMTELIDRGLLAWHLRRARKVYGRRHDVLVREVEAGLGAWFELAASSAGLHVCARVRAGSGLGAEGVEVVAARLAGEGVAIETLARYCAGEAQPGLVLGYGTIAEERIPKAVRRIVAAVREVAGPGGSA
ncbi:MAG: PLP-dependent aminotransferase family protein [Chloroflexota bacterium]